MGRRFFNFLSTLSLLACALLLAVWVGGFHYVESHTAARFVSVNHRGSHVGVFVYWKRDPQDRWHKDGSPVQIGRGNAHAFLNTERNFLDLQAGPVHAVTPAGEPLRAFVALAPLWVLCVIALVLPGMRLKLYAHDRRLARRARLGLCVKCGYDLRGSRGRCPECGEARVAAVG